MKRTATLILLLILGLLLSQLLPIVIGELPAWYGSARNFLMMTLLAFIMIEVGREFEIDLKNKRQYAVDYGVAATAAAFPWLLVTGYFLLFLMPETIGEGIDSKAKWIGALIVGRFAAPTSAGVLFSMLAASGLSGTWVYKKTRILAIFDDLDTVLLMIPLQMLIVGFVWQLGANIMIMALLIYLGIKFYRKINLPKSWHWLLFYSVIMVTLSELLYLYSKNAEGTTGIHVEILLPAFLLGCMFKNDVSSVVIPGEDRPGESSEEKAGLIISSAFMLLVGLSMPSAFGKNAEIVHTMQPSILIMHVLAVTLISNIGKMFACFCYKKEASFKERLAVGIAMFPRGEVGAGVLAISLSYGISAPYVTVAFMSLALNLILTGGFIFAVKKMVLLSLRDKKNKLAGVQV